jgi:hypothetical protein
MKIEFTVPFRHVVSPMTSLSELVPETQGNPLRIARLVALAHKPDGLVRSGPVSDYGELARLGRISPARLTQIMVLLHMAPQIQESLLFLPAGDARSSPSWGCAKSRASRAGIVSENFLKGFSRNDLLVGPRGVMNVKTRRDAAKKETAK